MLFVYLHLGFTFLFLLVASLAPFLIKYNAKIPTEEEEKAEALLEKSSPKIKKACKYECPHCGNRLLPDMDELDVRCYKCGHLWHPDYILTIHEDKDL